MAETNQEVKFKRGPSSTLPAEKDPGAFLVETDTGNMYLDDTAENRIQITDTRKVNKAGDTMTGPLDMGNQAINNLPEPAGDQNPATKHYVDVAFQEVESELGSLGTTYLPLKGGTMQGEIEMGEYNISSSHQPANPTDLVNKSYVDSQFAGAGTGDFMASGTVPMTGHYSIWHKYQPQQHWNCRKRRTYCKRLRYIRWDIRSTSSNNRCSRSRDWTYS